jgi:hypothetical protein
MHRLLRPLLSEDQTRVLLELAQDHILHVAMSQHSNRIDTHSKSLLLESITRLREALGED